jgi:hypothetical protein
MANISGRVVRRMKSENRKAENGKVTSERINFSCGNEEAFHPLDLRNPLPDFWTSRGKMIGNGNGNAIFL